MARRATDFEFLVAAQFGEFDIAVVSHRAFGFGDEAQAARLLGAGGKQNRPIGAVIADGRRDFEVARQFQKQIDVVALRKIAGKLALDLRIAFDHIVSAVVAGFDALYHRFQNRALLDGEMLLPFEIIVLDFFVGDSGDHQFGERFAQGGGGGVGESDRIFAARVFVALLQNPADGFAREHKRRLVGFEDLAHRFDQTGAIESAGGGIGGIEKIEARRIRRKNAARPDFDSGARDCDFGRGDDFRAQFFGGDDDELFGIDLDEVASFFA